MPTLTDEILIAAIETSAAIMPEIPGRLQHVSLPDIDIRGRITQIAHPFANNVCCANLAGDIGAKVNAVCSLYWSKDLPFSWTIGPGTAPSDIRTWLEAAGLQSGAQMAGLAFTDLTRPFPFDPAVQVEEVPTGDIDRGLKVSQIAAGGFGLPEELCELFLESFSRSYPIRTRAYLATAPGAEEPEAFAAALYLPDVPIVLLSGAATLPSARGKGLYQALVARRLADAHNAGMQAAIIQAVRTTSAPILMKRGFVELCGLETWHGLPPSMRNSATPEAEAHAGIAQG